VKITTAMLPPRLPQLLAHAVFDVVVDDKIQFFVVNLKLVAKDISILSIIAFDFTGLNCCSLLG